MKKYFHILTLFLSINTSAQVPDYFANNPTWHCEFTKSNTPYQWWDINYVEDFVYYVNGDTTISGQTYHWIHKRGIQTDYPEGTVTSFDYPTDYFFRQEGRTLRYYDQNFGVDSLCLDYNMQIGDSIGVQYSGGQSSYDTVTVIDSILIGSEYRRIFTIGNGYSTFVEGIGYYWDYNMAFAGEMFKYPYASPDFFTDYICYGQNDQPIWGPESGLNTSCYVNVGIKEKEELNPLIHPIPADNFINIEVPQELIESKLSICDLQGRLHLETKIQNASELINIEHLSNSAYIITVSNEEFYFTERIIIQH